VRSDPKKYGPVLLKNVNVSEKGEIQKEEIIVRRDDFILGKNTNPWEEVFPEFTKKMNLKDESMLKPGFSTSTTVSAVACDIVTMDMLQDFFEYVFMTECGIPRITVYGTHDDYKSLIARVEKLAAELDMNSWLEHFQYTMKNLTWFLGVSDDSKEFAFFESFYKLYSGSGGPDVTGWINVFFPFLRDGKENPSADWYSKNSPRHGPSPIDYPTGISTAPVTWQYYGIDHKYQFCAGMIGSSVTAESDLTPTIGWYVRPTPEEKNSVKEK
jgi:hypothetical protein